MSNAQSLCESCRHLREVVSGKGSRFLMCLLSQSDSRWRKYPPQPVRECAGYDSASRKSEE
jgi:hypothetical protein